MRHLDTFFHTSRILAIDKFLWPLNYISAAKAEKIKGSNESLFSFVALHLMH